VRVVTCNGCFDGLHPGHMFFLGYCRGQGSKLIVGINTDDYIRRKKRSDPVPEKDRVAALISLGVAEKVEVFPEDSPCEFIRRNMPDVHCIGEEYRGRAPEEKVCAELGIWIVYVPRIGKWSSTGMRKAAHAGISNGICPPQG